MAWWKICVIIGIVLALFMFVFGSIALFNKFAYEPANFEKRCEVLAEQKNMLNNGSHKSYVSVVNNGICYLCDRNDCEFGFCKLDKCESWS